MRLRELQTINEMAKNGTVIDSVQGPITQDQLEQWLDEYGIDVDEFNITDGRLNILTDFTLEDSDNKVSQIPVPLGKIAGDFNASIKPLSTFVNFPLYVEESVFCYETQISSFEGLNIECGGNFDLIMNKNLSDFRGIHKHIRRMNGTFKFDLENIHVGGLGILLIPGVKKIDCGDANISEIFNKYLKTGQVLEAQEHLIDGGYAYLARV